MKRKVTVNSLAFGNLKQRRKQYSIMIIGIILSMVFSSSVLFLITAIYDSTTEIRNERFGKESIIWSNVSDDDVQDAKKQKILGTTGYGHIIGSISSTDEDILDSCTVAWFDDTALELGNPILIEGTYPTNENEIAIESIMLSKMGISAKVGDTITLNFNVQNGTETFDNSIQKEYKLVGILKNKVNYISFATGIDESNVPSAFVCKNTAVDLGGKEKLVCYADFYNGEFTKSNYRKLENYVKSSESENYFAEFTVINNNLVYYLNDNTAGDMQNSVVFVIIIIAVLMLASCLGIVNSFNTNLKERKKQIGLLRAVGATKKQIINIFGREAFAISIISVPISCVLSFLVVKVIIKLMGDGYFFKLHIWALALSVLFSIFCVMLSALIPLISATKITPMQAVRDIDDLRKMKNKSIKSKKEFDVSKLISNRSIVFKKGKQVAVSFILIIAILSSGYALSWYSYEKNDIYTVDSDYELNLSSDVWYSTGVNFKSSNNGYSEADKQIIESNQYIALSNGVKQARANLIVPYSISDYRKILTNYYNMDHDNYDESEITSDNYQDAYFYEIYNSIDDEKIQELVGCDEFISVDYKSSDSDYLKSLSNYVYDGEINIDKINSG